MTKFMISRRLALALWTVWAILVWNVVFDHALEVAGKHYVPAAGAAAAAGGPYVRIDDWMRPALAWGLWTASAAAGVVTIVGLAAVRFAASRERRAAAGPPQRP